MSAALSTNTEIESIRLSDNPLIHRGPPTQRPTNAGQGSSSSSSGVDAAAGMVGVAALCSVLAGRALGSGHIAWPSLNPQAMQSLVSLDLSGCGLDEVALRLLSTALFDVPLQRLFLARNHGLTGPRQLDSGRYKPAIPGAKDTRYGVVLSGWQNFCAQLSTGAMAKSLKVLDVSDCKLTHGAVMALVRVLRKMVSLGLTSREGCLDLSRNEMGPDGEPARSTHAAASDAALATALAENFHGWGRAGYVCQCKLGAEASHEPVLVPMHNPRLADFSSGRVPLQPADSVVLVAALSTNLNLLSLDLARVRLGAMGKTALATVLWPIIPLSGANYSYSRRSRACELSGHNLSKLQQLTVDLGGGSTTATLTEGEAVDLSAMDLRPEDAVLLAGWLAHAPAPSDPKEQEGSRRSEVVLLNDNPALLTAAGATDGVLCVGAWEVLCKALATTKVHTLSVRNIGLGLDVATTEALQLCCRRLRSIRELDVARNPLCREGAQGAGLQRLFKIRDMKQALRIKTEYYG